MQIAYNNFNITITDTQTICIAVFTFLIILLVISNEKRKNYVSSLCKLFSVFPITSVVNSIFNREGSKQITTKKPFNEN